MEEKESNRINKKEEIVKFYKNNRYTIIPVEELNDEQVELIYKICEKKLDINDIVIPNEILSGIVLLFLGNYHKINKNIECAEKYYLMSIEKGYVLAMNNLGFLYNEQKKYDLTEKYYLMAIEKGDVLAMNNLGVLYKEQKKYDLAEKYFLMAIEKRNAAAMNNLGFLYNERKKYDLAEKYFLMAIENGKEKARENIINLYKVQGKMREGLTALVSIHRKRKIDLTNEIMELLRNNDELIREYIHLNSIQDTVLEERNTYIEKRDAYIEQLELLPEGRRYKEVQSHYDNTIDASTKIRDNK